MSLTLLQKFRCWRIDRHSKITRLWILLFGIVVAAIWLTVFIQSVVAFSKLQENLAEVDSAANKMQQQFKRDVNDLLSGQGYH